MYFDNINLLRAFAALSVLVYHVIEFFPWKSFPITGPLLWFRIGWLGVDLFFVISGFVITLSASQLFESHGNKFYKIYLRRRIARIFPLYLLTGVLFVLFCEPFILKDLELRFKNLIYHLLFIHNIYPETHNTINAPNWTVGVEMQFYLLVMLTIRLITRLHPGLILLGCVIISWLWRAMVIWNCQAMGCDTFGKFFLSGQIIGQLDEFGFGIFLCRIVLDRTGQFIPLSSIYRKPWFWTVIFLPIAWLTFTIYWRWSSYWDFWWMIVFWKTLSGLVFFTVLATGIWLTSLINLNKFIFKPIWYLGEISYGIYLWHYLVIKSLNETKAFTGVEFLFWTLFFTIALSVFSWHFLEKPLIKRFR